MSVGEQRRSFKLTAFGSPLAEVVEAPPSPQGSEVLLRVGACGVCHSDLHLFDGYFDLGHAHKLDLTRSVSLPKVLGHEIVGTVVAVGPEAQGVGVGDRRVVYPWTGCGACPACKDGFEQLCATPRCQGTTLDGGFSTHVLVEHPRYLEAFDPLPESFAATLACSSLTAFSALKKAAPVDAERPLVIVGAGGVGLAATALARAVYGLAPVVADIDPAKRQAALEAGASAAIDPADTAARKALVKESGGIAAVIDFVGAEASAQFGLSLLRKGGRLVIVGLFGGALAVPLPTIPMRGISVIGSYVGTLADFREVVALARAGHLSPMPIETRPLAAAQQALDDLRAGRIRGRAVLTP